MVSTISWDTPLQFAFILVLLGISLVIKANIKFFKKHLIPTALLGGLIGLIFGPELLGWVPARQCDTREHGLSLHGDRVYLPGAKKNAEKRPARILLTPDLRLLIHISGKP